MKPMLDNRILGACAAVGALGATCTVAVDAHGAGAKQSSASAAFTWPTNPTLATKVLFERPKTKRHPDPIKRALKRMIRAGNRIARLPYVWGGGHGSFAAAGYDCSGSVSYVLHAAGLIGTPMDSSGLESYGLPGPGKHITVYATGGHAWMTINGRRFDTIAFQETGSRWSSTIGSTAGYVARHPRGF